MQNNKKNFGRPSLSLDGFVTGPSPLLRQRRHRQTHAKWGDDFVRSTSAGQLASPQLDNFKVPEGFASSENTEMAMPNDRVNDSEISFNSARPSSLGAMATAFTAEGTAQKRKRLFKRRKDKNRLHKAVKPKRRLGKLIFKTSATITVCLILLAGFIFGKLWLKAHKIFQGDGGGGAAALNKDVDPIQLKGEGDGRINILLLGKSGPGHEGPDLTDTLLVASIDPIANEAALLSVPRDLYVKTPSGGSSKINSIYANAKYAVLNRAAKATTEVNNQAEKAGIDAIESTVSQSMGIPIHYYVMIDFEAFRQAIDTVGGVDINATEQLYDPTVAWENNNNPVLAKVGQNLMNGKQALLYARSRHGSARGDFDRTERQRAIILALKNKVLSAGTYANPLKVSQLIDAFGDHVSTNLRLDEVGRLYDITKKIDANKVKSIGLADPPNNYVTTDNVAGISIVRPRAGLYVYTEIQSYVRNVLRDSFLKSEDAKLFVLNGTGIPGLATTKADELKSYGYTVTKVDSTPTSTYTKTVLVDLTNGTKKYTLNYLQKRVGVTATRQLPDNTIDSAGADFVIILGSNESTGQ